MIQGVIIRSLRVIPDSRGDILHMLRSDDDDFTGFGEIYFSEIGSGVVKTWRRHLRHVSRIAVPVGQVHVHLFDGRQQSATYESSDLVSLGRTDHKLVIIPPGIWSLFVGRGNGVSLITNCTDYPHDPLEVERADADDSRFPTNWKD